jgi:exopolysaccharide biosynthesis polyprenyl glycosylphosphotransferase
MQIHQLMDACLFALAFWLAMVLRSHPWVMGWLKLAAAPPDDTSLWFILLLIPAAPAVLEWQGFYDRSLGGLRRRFLVPLLSGTAILTGLLVFLLFFFRVNFARWVVLWFPAIAFSLLYVKEEILRFLYVHRMGVDQARRRFLLAGTPQETARLRQEIERERGEMEVVAELDLNQTTPARLVQLLHDHSINGVLINARHIYFERVETFIRACELEGVEAWLMADFFQTQISQPSFDEFAGRPVLVFRSAPSLSWAGVGKQLIDFIGAFLLLLLTLPLLVVVGLIIRFTSPGPVFFRQERAGLNGRPFTMYKFRTMVTNAEQLKQELAALNEMSGPVFKLTHDPRVTPIGRWLRKFSLDEFPQLFNVIRGDMSLVGPRPLPIYEVARFDDPAHRRRLSMRPGLTCLWQVSGRSQLTKFEEWVRLDLQYIDNWSLWLDLKILLRTIPVVLLGTGAK